MDIDWVERLILPAMGRRPMTNSEIYRQVRSRARTEGIKLSPYWRATVRNTLQRHAKGHTKAIGKKKLFVHVDRGMWKRRS